MWILNLSRHGLRSMKTLIKKRRKFKWLYSKDGLFEGENDSEYLEWASCSIPDMVEYLSRTQSADWASLSMPNVINFIYHPQSTDQVSYSTLGMVEHVSHQQLANQASCSTPTVKYLFHPRSSTSPTYSQQIETQAQCLMRWSTSATHNREIRPHAQSPIYNLLWTRKK